MIVSKWDRKSPKHCKNCKNKILQNTNPIIIVSIYLCERDEVSKLGRTLLGHAHTICKLVIGLIFYAILYVISCSSNEN